MARKNLEKVDYLGTIKAYIKFVSKYKFTFILILLLTFIGQATHLVDKYLFKIIIDNGPLFTNGSLGYDTFVRILLFAGLIYLITISARAILSWFTLHFLAIFECNIMFDLKKKYFDHILHLSHKFHTSHKTGGLISKLIRGSNAIERLTDLTVFNFSPLIFQIIIGFASIFYFDKLSALIVVITSIVFTLYAVFINYLQQDSTVKANDAEDDEKGNISDIFTNVESIKYFGKEDSIKNRFGNVATKTKNAMRKAWWYGNWQDSGLSFIGALGLFFLIYFPLLGFLNGRISIGTLVFIYTVYTGLVGSLWNFTVGIRDLYRATADFKSLLAYDKIQNDINDLPNAKNLNIKKGVIEFRNISFSYNNRKILRDFSLIVPENKKVALVGPSGAGKSTVIKLLYRLYDVNTGEILIDGENINNFKQESLRSELSIVPQECVLFDDTIYNNIKFSNPSATREDVFRAMKFAQLDKIVSKFPNKENTIVGERGIKLSGGEKQRVSIARAILADKKVLVLDEATSALDSETEHEIQRDLEKLMKDRTSIIIAHRLSTIMKADIIVVIQDGRILEVDTHKELIKKPGIYKKLWELQKGGYSKQ